MNLNALNQHADEDCIEGSVSRESSLADGSIEENSSLKVSLEQSSGERKGPTESVSFKDRLLGLFGFGKKD